MAAYTDHYAVIVGVQKYPGIGDLEGPNNDVQEMADWLVNPDGGNVHPDNIKKLTSASFPDWAQDMQANQAKPRRDDLALLFEDFVALGLENPPYGQRLYFYVAGHGFGDPLDMTQAALFAANAKTPYSPHLAVTAYANWFKRNGIFNEILLLADCCRSVDPMTSIIPPELPNVSNPILARRVKTFYAYATNWAFDAREKEFDGVKKGVFTQSLLNALQTAEPNRSGNITGTAIKKHIHNVFKTFAVDPEDAGPEIDADSNKDIVVLRGKGVVLFDFTVNLDPYEGGETVRIYAGPNDIVAEATMASSTVTFQLASGYYKAVVVSTARSSGLKEVVGTDVEVTI
ncbi:MAG: caspase family protein [Erythrobacter sp.]|nr:caspase family protein [Erythrobacter sp.]